MSLPSYTGTKTVLAAKITGVTAAKDDKGNGLLCLEGESDWLISSDWLLKHCPPGGPQEFVGGYLVIYEDGYTSWSPAEPFEKAYRLDNAGIDALPRTEIYGTVKWEALQTAVRTPGVTPANLIETAKACEAYLAG